MKKIPFVKSFGFSLGEPLFLFFFFLCIVTRAHLSNIKVGKYYSDSFYVFKECLGHDLPLFVIFILLSLVSSFFRQKMLSNIIKIFQFMVVGFYVADLLVLYEFSLRFYFNDLIHYGMNNGDLPLLVLFFNDPFILLFTLCWLVSGLMFVAFSKPVHWLPKPIIAGFCFFGLLTVLVREETRAPSDWVLRNFVEVNLSAGVDIDYNQKFQEDILSLEDRFAPSLVQSNSKSEKINFIILIVEGLSNWQSHAISGLANITPHIDRIASENTLFKNFYANGYNTEGGLIALLAGEVPLPKLSGTYETDKFNGFGEELTVPGMLGSVGYWTEFLTTGDLYFTGKSDWLHKIGFNRIEGHDAPFYDGLKRFHFSAASDQYLYNRVLSRIEELTQGPYCVVVETVSSHQPFIDPFTGELSPVEVPFIYADEMIGKFYDALKKKGFFEDGVLFIVGDHRSMTPLVPGEYQMYGESSTARVPFVISDGGRSEGRVIDEPFQQTDILSSLMSAYTDVQIISPFYGDFFADPVRSPQYILHARGDDRSLVSVFNGHDQATIKLRGDNTGLVDGKVEDVAFVVDKINYDRISRAKLRSRVQGQ